MQPYIIAKYREFQELGKNWRNKNQSAVLKEIPTREGKDSGKVPSLKIRISTRKKKRNAENGDDSDHEFEQLLKAHEKQQDDEEKAKEERRQSRRAAAAAKKKAKAEEVIFLVDFHKLFIAFRLSIKIIVRLVNKEERFCFAILALVLIT